VAIKPEGEECLSIPVSSGKSVLPSIILIVLESNLMSNLYIGLLVLVGVVLTALVLRFILSNSSKSKETFESIDGTRFVREKDLKEYEFLYERLKCLYEENPSGNKNRQNLKLGLKVTFIQKLKSEGFSSLNLLISNKDQFKKLIELFDTSAFSVD